MIDGLLDRNREVVRQTLRDSNVARVENDNAAIDDAVSYFERLTDHETVRGAVKARFAVGIKRQNKSEDSDLAGGYETYRRGAVAEMVDQGLVETLTAGVGGRIISALGNLFTSETQSWTYTDEAGEATDQATEAEEIIKAHREAGGFPTAMVKADQLSCAINSSLVYVAVRGDALKYHVVSPSNFYAIFHQTIEDSGEERAVDYSEIEDATVIVLRMADNIQADPTKQQYLAIFGRSEEYPYGRHVTYRASRWHAIPDVGDTDSQDYTLPSGEIANPLSYLASQNPDESVPEYPIITLDGGMGLVSNDIVNPTTSLYENCLEFDIGYSRLLKDALNAARGKDVISNPFNAPLPRNLEGVVSLSKDQQLDVKGQPASNAQGAMAVLESAVTSVAAGYNVPGYMIVSGPDMLGDISGVALMIRTTPLIEFRKHRIALNNTEVARLWGIERGLLRVHFGSEYEFMANIKQNWDAGNYVVPEDALAKTERLAKAEEHGYIDYVRAVQTYHNLATAEQAEALIEEMEARKAEYPSPKQSAAPTNQRQAQPVGLTFNR